MTIPQLDLDIRIHTPQKAGSAAAAAGWLVASVVFLLRFRGSALLAAGAVDAVLACALAIPLSRLGRLGFSLRKDELVFHGLFSDRVIDPLTAHVLELNVGGRGAPASGYARWCIIDGDGHCRAVIKPDGFDRGQLDVLSSRLGGDRVVVDGVVPLAQARADYPGVVQWWAAYPLVTCLVGIAAFLLLFELAKLIV